jgi:tripartite-type tricarboxylate transporter receptor subunit TctC
MRRFALLALSVCTLLMGGTAAAEDGKWPSAPIHFVVPYAPGGAIDFVARLIGEKLGDRLGKSIIVENRPGASTQIATTHVAHAAPDGYTLLFTDISHGSNPALRKHLPYDTMKDFASVILVADLPAVLVVSTQSHIESVADLIAHARKEPGKLNYSSAGPGTIGHLAAELFKKQFGLDIVQVTYQGAGPAMTAVLKGECQMLFLGLPPAIPLIKAGSVKAIAVTSATRSALLPDVPTMADSGFPGFTFEGSVGIRAPAGTPEPVIATLNQAINEVLQDPTVKTRMENAGAVIVGGPPQRFTDYLNQEIDRWTRTIPPQMRID